MYKLLIASICNSPTFIHVLNIIYVSDSGRDATYYMGSCLCSCICYTENCTFVQILYISINALDRFLYLLQSNSLGLCSPAILSEHCHTFLSVQA